MNFILHISDLHFTTDAQWNIMKHAIFAEVSEKLKNIQCGHKMLLISGDLHNFIDKNYVNALEFIKQLANEMNISLEDDVFIVPGNHDASNRSDTLADDVMAKIRSDKNNTKLDSKRKEELLKPFSGYVELVKALGLYNGSVNPAEVHVRTWRQKLHILHLNTAIVADGITKDNQLVEIDMVTSDEIRMELKRDGLPIIVMGHNDFYDLEENQQNNLCGYFDQLKVSAYLCGDKHRIDSPKGEQHIYFSSNTRSDTAKTIPNIVCYKGVADKNDTYSNVGIMWHEWDEVTSKVQVTYSAWDPTNQATLQPAPKYSFTYDLKGDLNSSCNPTHHQKSNPIIVGDNWILIDSEIEKRELKPESISSFLYGKECTWSIAFSNSIVKRKVLKELVDSAKSGGITILLGAGGEGKSTLLKQMCAELYKEGKSVLYHKETMGFSIPQNSADVIYVVDNPINTSEFKSFLNGINENEQTLVLCSRHNEWNLLKESQGICTRNINEVRISNITERDEAEGFADCVLKYTDIKEEKAEIVKIFMHNAYGFLYAAMLMLVHKKSTLEEISENIIKNLSDSAPKALDLLANIVMSEHVNMGFSNECYQQICEEINITPKKATEALALEVKRTGDIYCTRHEKISSVFYSLLFSSDGYLNISKIGCIHYNFLKFHMAKYDSKYGAPKQQYWENILNYLPLIVEVSEEDQKSLLNLLLDYCNSNVSRLSDIQKTLRTVNLRRMFFIICYERKVNNPVSMLDWAELELELENIGDYYTPNTAKWIYKEMCINNQMDSNLWIAWAKMELELENVGNYETQHSARWIYREGCMTYEADANAWSAWATLEIRLDNVGDYHLENSARWIIQNSIQRNKINSTTWNTWAKLEVSEGNVGEYSIQNTARWIFRKACIENNADATTWSAWARLEVGEGNVGEYNISNTARWIFHKACIENNADANTWCAWARLEVGEGNVGEYSIPNTARWVFKKAIENEKNKNDTQLWEKWAMAEEEQGNIGATDVENSARWIYKKAYSEENIGLSLWLRWAKLEERELNIGSEEIPYSAIWIYESMAEKALKQKETVIEIHYIRFLLENNRLVQAKKILRRTVQFKDSLLQYLALLELYTPKIAPDEEFSLNRLLQKIKASKPKSKGALIGYGILFQQLNMSTEFDIYKEYLKDVQYEKIVDYYYEFIEICKTYNGNIIE